MTKRARSPEASTVTDQQVEEIVSQPYRHELRRNEDGTWFAKVIELPGCMTEGDTEVDALENLQDAMRAWVRVQLEDGEPIPPPSAEAKFSGKFVVRVAPSLHRELVERAAQEGISLNALVSMALARAVSPSVAGGSTGPFLQGSYFAASMVSAALANVPTSTNGLSVTGAVTSVLTGYYDVTHDAFLGTQNTARTASLSGSGLPGEVIGLAKSR